MSVPVNKSSIKMDVFLHIVKRAFDAHTHMLAFSTFSSSEMKFVGIMKRGIKS